MDYKQLILPLAVVFCAYVVAADVHDYCPFNDGVFYPFKDGWKAINVTKKPVNKVKGPGKGQEVGPKNFGGINLRSVMEKLDQSVTHCLICYAYPSKKTKSIKLSTRLLCLPDGCGANDKNKPGCKVTEAHKSRRVKHEKGKINIISTAIDPKTGRSEDYGCNIVAYEQIAVTRGTSKMQCWMKPLPKE